MRELYNNIDDRSRAAARNIRIAFDEKAWAKMEALLEEEASEPVTAVAPKKFIEDRAGSKTSRWLQLFLVCFLSWASVLFIKNNASLKTASFPLTPDGREELATKTAKASEAKQKNNNRGAKQDADHYQYRQLKKNHLKNLKVEATKARKTTLPVAINNKYKVNKALNSKNKKSVSKVDLPIACRDVRENNRFDFTLGGESETGISKNIKGIPDETNDNDLERKENQLRFEIDNTKKSIGEVMASLNTDVTEPPNTVKQNKNNSRPAKSLFKTSRSGNFGFSVFISPEANTVKFKTGDKITMSYGAGINYLIGKHLSLLAQFVKSRKEYATDKNGYNPTSVTSFVAIDTLAVNADCNVWDIPVSLRYSFTGNSKNTFFASAGISSYIMKKEIYNFSYYDQGIYKTNQRIIENENKHGFCNLNLSAGYQYWLNKKWSMGLESYLKLPLKGIGAGNVKLTTTGALLSLTFKP